MIRLVKSIARALNENLVRIQKTFPKTEKLSNLNDDQESAIAIKLEHYTSYWTFSIWHEGVYHQSRCQIKKRWAAYVMSTSCSQLNCAKNKAFIWNTRKSITKSTLIKEAQSMRMIHVLSGKCPLCKTYYADHESSGKNDDEDGGGSVSSIEQMQISQSWQSVWVDRVFKGVINECITSSSASPLLNSEWHLLVFPNTSRKYLKTNLAHFCSRIYQQLPTLWSDCGNAKWNFNEEVTKQAFIQLGDSGVTAVLTTSCSDALMNKRNCEMLPLTWCIPSSRMYPIKSQNR